MTPLTPRTRPAALLTAALTILLIAASVSADQIPVRYQEGSVHGYLAVPSLQL